MKKILRFSALLLGILIGLLYLLLSFDSFPQSFDGRAILGFLLHATPGLIIIVSSLIAFRYPKAGVVLFIILAAVVTIYFHTYRNLQYFTLLSLPLIAISLILFATVSKKGTK